MDGANKCECPECCASPKHSYSPAFRLECEARAVLSWPLAQRREYLAAKLVEGRRAQLEAEMKRQWAAK